MSSRIANVHAQTVGERHFRSTLEAQTAETLDALGIPYAYEEKRIELVEGFRSPYQKDKVRAIHYIPDFIIGPIMLECKGFETPEWKLKKKLVFKWLMENEPDTIFYQLHDAGKSLLQMLDRHLGYLGFKVQVTRKPGKKKQYEPQEFDSVTEAMEELGLKGKALGPILSSLTGNKPYTYGYQWKLIKSTF